MYNYIEPFTDENLRYDEKTKKYYLTEEALISQGIDIRMRIAEGNSTSPEYIINGFINRVTAVIYAYIHNFNIDNNNQDFLISHIPSARDIIFNALINQAIYMYRNGDLTLSINAEERERAYDDVALSELNKTMPETGYSLLYTGNFFRGDFLC